MASETSNKKYVLQTNGENPGTWGAVLNSQMIEYVDANMGGITSKALTSGAVSLDATESRNAILRLTGALSGNVTITTLCRGFFFVENLTTGAYTVTIRNDAVATSTVVAQSTRATLISDITNGVRIAGQDGFASGTTLVFYQAAAPTGWTRLATQQDKALRVVDGTTSAGGVAGGTTAFTSVFAARTLTASNLPNFSVTVTDPGHTHTVGFAGPISLDNANGSGSRTAFVNSNSTTTSSKTTGISAAFGNTARGGAQTSIDFAVQYINVIICSKD